VGLTDEQIRRLIEKKSQPRKRGGGGRKKEIDTSVRDYSTWFALAHKLYDEDTQELSQCENPNCPGTGHLVALVSGRQMCRICFLDGWLAENPDQLEIT
jgi:hypothetical protein